MRTKDNKSKKPLSEEEKKIKKERFIQDFCKKKGWNPKELSISQMLRITREDGYKNPIRN